MAMEWSLETVLSVLLMWWVMMVVMMMPGITQRIGHYSDLHPKNGALTKYADIAFFISGYTILWLLFSIFATSVQYVLVGLSLLHSTELNITEPNLAASLFLAIGLYQLSPSKGLRLERCRTDVPTGFPLRDGTVLGFHCVINSGPLMLLLFVGGVMNFHWIISLSVINVLERNLSSPKLLSSFVGIACILAAGILIVPEVKSIIP